MINRVLSPVLVGRQEQLSQLEDALLTANRGDGRFVLQSGEAGIGKTRLATELKRRARKLGCDVLWGRCSEAELPLPYLPFVEAIGNRLGDQDSAALRAKLGPMVAELARVFPQLAEGPATADTGDPAQAKLRLFESVVGLLELWARSRTVLVVLDDIHWADSSTRELLEYAARRLARSRVMLLATHRSDELDRRHPLTRAVQVWRRGGLAEAVSVGAMAPQQVAEMIAAILGAEEVSTELAALVHDRSEGNPFVLEEMLKEALDRGEVFRSDTGWERRPLDAFRLPDTVREAVLLRLGRLEPEHVDVLRAAAVLGRSFDYGLLVEVAGADEGGVLAALEVAVAQQLLEEDAGTSDRYSWRHALTQEAIASDTVLPKRMRTHSRAADALLAAGSSALVVARHLLAGGRAEEAVDACLRAVEEAGRAVAVREATDLLERVLPARDGSTRSRAAPVPDGSDVDVPPVEEPGPKPDAPAVLPAGERLVTSLFADVRGYTPMTTASVPEELTDRLTTLHRWAAAEVGKRQGIVDKFAGDAIMATFNATRRTRRPRGAGARCRARAQGQGRPRRSARRDRNRRGPRRGDPFGRRREPERARSDPEPRGASPDGRRRRRDPPQRRGVPPGGVLVDRRGLTAEPEELELKGFEEKPADRLPLPTGS